MLILTRRVDGKILIGESISITVVEIRENSVRLGIDAPPGIEIDREEIRRDKERHGRRRSGFTLLEMSTALIIVGLLSVWLIPPAMIALDQKKQDQTVEQIRMIRETLTGYAVINGRLPCVADVTGAADCSSVSGYLPGVALAIDPRDAYGGIWRYTVADQDLTLDMRAGGGNGPAVTIETSNGAAKIDINRNHFSYYLIVAGRQ